MNLRICSAGCRLGMGPDTPTVRGDRRGGGGRGKIQGFSRSAASRLRWFLVSQWVPGFRPWTATRTIHRAATPDDWRECQGRWRWCLNRRGWAEVGRVQLQRFRLGADGVRRRVPHAHSVVWVPEDVSDEQIRNLWLQCSRESDDPAARAHAIMLRAEVGTSPAWVAYVAGHAGREVAAQAGWKGKQWWVINRRLFRAAPGSDVQLTDFSARWFARLVRRWAKSKYGIRVFTSERGFARAMDGAALPSLVRAALLLGGQPIKGG